MIGADRHFGRRTDRLWSALLHVAIAVIVAYPPGYIIHQILAATPALSYVVQELPFEPLIGDQKCVITVFSIANEGRVALTGVQLRAEFLGRVYHSGAREHGRARVRLDNLASDATTSVFGVLDRLRIGERLSVGVISSGPLAGEPKLVSDEVIGIRATGTRPASASTALLVVVCVVVLLGAVGYPLLFFIHHARVTRGWARLLGQYALANRGALRLPRTLL